MLTILSHSIKSRINIQPPLFRFLIDSISHFHYHSTIFYVIGFAIPWPYNYQADRYRAPVTSSTRHIAAQDLAIVYLVSQYNAVPLLTIQNSVS
jgi:hypothetical protein